MKKSRLVASVIAVLTILTLIVTCTPSVRKNVKLGLDSQGGFEIPYEVNPLKGKKLPFMTAVAKLVEKRVDVLGVNEPEITVEGDNRTRVQLAGVKNADQAKRVISSTANLTLRDMNDSLLMDSTVLQESGVSAMYDNYGKPIVNLKLSDQKKFYEVTQKVSQVGSGSNLMVAWLNFNLDTDSYAKEKDQKNPKFISAAAVSEGVNSTSAQISGSFTKEEATELKDLINSGSLPVKMSEEYSNAVTADYSINAFSETMLADGTGTVLIMLFMILYYRLPGLISAATLATYVFIVFLIYSAMDVVFTLSGIAVLVLGVGMATDSNILTFERIRGVLYSGRSAKTAFYEGSSKSSITIFDAQVTTFTCALILYMMGTGSVKGFMIMLIVSTIPIIILIVFVIKFLLSPLVGSGWLNDKLNQFGVKKAHVPDVNKGQEHFYFSFFKSFDFIKNVKYFIIASVAVLVIGVGRMVFQGMKGNGILNRGIDFTSGTKLTVQSDTAISRDKLDDQLKSLGINASSIKINGEKDNVVNTFMKDAIDEHKTDIIKAGLKRAYQHDVNDSVVTPVIGQELVHSAILISILAWIGALIYISTRFKWGHAISGIVGLIHDAFLVLVACAIFRLEVNTEIVAVLLTVIGYSINSSIVVFNRIRDEMKGRKLTTTTKAEYHEVVNETLQRTATRSILSMLTTILPVVYLLLFGSSAIHIFCLALFIGIACGAGSSLFVAAQLWYQIRIHQNPKKHIKEKHKKKKDELEEMVTPSMNDY